MVKINHKNKDDCITVISSVNTVHMANMFNGKFIKVPIIVSIMASRNAGLFSITYII